MQKVSILGTVEEYVWASQVLIIIVASWAVYKLVNLLLKTIMQKFCSQHNWCLEISIKAIKKPISFLILALGIIAVISVFDKNTDIMKWFSQDRIIKITVVGFCAWCAIRFITLMQEHMMHHSKKPYDKTAVLAFGQIGVALIIVFSILMIMQFAGINFTGLLAFGGFSGIAIGFAAKDLLANFFGALMIYMDKPFKVGDWIRSPDREIEGEVESIGWRQTKIMTFEKRPIYVPNSLFSTVVVENPSRMTHRRLNETIGIRHEDLSKINDIVDDIKELLIDHSRVDNSQTLVVSVAKVSPSSIDILVYCFTLTTTLFDFSQVRQDILLGAAKIIAKHNAKIANPTVQITSIPEQFLIKQINV